MEIDDNDALLLVLLLPAPPPRLPEALQGHVVRVSQHAIGGGGRRERSRSKIESVVLARGVVGMMVWLPCLIGRGLEAGNQAVQELPNAEMRPHIRRWRRRRKRRRNKVQTPTHRQKTWLNGFPFSGPPTYYVE